MIERQIPLTPLLYLSAFFEAARRDYYDGMRGISERGAWNDWLEYFLLGVARMSEDALNRAARINATLADCQRQVAGDSTNGPSRVVEFLAANPFITVKRAAAKFCGLYDRPTCSRTPGTTGYSGENGETLSGIGFIAQSGY